METETQIDYKKLFQMFVGNDEMRPRLNRLFKVDGKYVATDAHSMIFLPVDKIELDIQEYPDSPRVDGVIPAKTNCNVEINISDIERQLIPEMIDETEECYACNGEGEQECDLGHLHECIRCNGEGDIKKKNGNKVPNPNTKFEMLEAGFTYKQLKRLVDAVKIIGVDKITKTFGTKEGANMFHVGDFGIIVMPYRMEEYAKPIKIIL